MVVVVVVVGGCTVTLVEKGAVKELEKALKTGYKKELGKECDTFTTIPGEGAGSVELPKGYLDSRHALQKAIIYVSVGMWLHDVIVIMQAGIHALDVLINVLILCDYFGGFGWPGLATVALFAGSYYLYTQKGGKKVNLGRVGTSSCHIYSGLAIRQLDS